MEVMYFTELKEYEISYLERELGLEFLQELLKESICSKKKTRQNQYITINFVGLLTYKEKIACLLPKHIIYESCIDKDNSKFHDILLTIQVLKKYQKRNIRKLGSEFYGMNEEFYNSNLFALVDILLRDFMIYGYYMQEQEEFIDGIGGSIDWRETISEVSPYFIGGTPHYLNTKSQRINDDERNFISAIHQQIIYECYHKLGGFLGYKLLDIKRPTNKVNIKENSVYITNLLRKELQNVYTDSKIRVLKSLIAYINMNFVLSNQGLSVFGTKEFEYVWQDICFQLFDGKAELYKDYFPKVKWENHLNNNDEEAGRFKPDILAEFEENFLILDAKYYKILKQNNDFDIKPGINDISKQHLYEKILGVHFKNTINALLFPDIRLKSCYRIIGRAHLELISKNSIMLVAMNSRIAFELYCQNKKYSSNIVRGMCQRIKKIKKFKRVT
ncbi:LlaJI family restriction endonuclease [Bacillus sp. HNR-4]|uniref:LlaJI family restriction endonuclease n=1 Tax=Bacillus sp. HNR-4 TaxID=2796141 RepID=UPI00237972AD|nr:LlaJI family restriction endonuclease [Bacillus sp. HNR-4]WDL93008.1 LlaJI family restriction endonuclease [Bacillus sp. HNR-4]